MVRYGVAVEILIEVDFDERMITTKDDEGKVWSYRMSKVMELDEEWVREHIGEQVRIRYKETNGELEAIKIEDIEEDLLFLGPLAHEVLTSLKRHCMHKPSPLAKYDVLPALTSVLSKNITGSVKIWAELNYDADLKDAIEAIQHAEPESDRHRESIKTIIDRLTASDVPDSIKGALKKILVNKLLRR